MCIRDRASVDGPEIDIAFNPGFLLDGLGAGWLHPHGRHLAKSLPVPGSVIAIAVISEPSMQPGSQRWRCSVVTVR